MYKNIKYAGGTLAIISVLLLLISLFPVRVEPYNEIVEEFEIPEVTEQYMIEIFNFKDLYNFVQLFYDRAQTYYVVSLRNDIILPEGQGNLSIGTYEKPFWGEFQGNDYKIGGVNIYGTDDETGFFNYIESAKINRLHIEGNISSSECGGTGGIAGRSINSQIEYCSFSGTVEASEGSVGGIVGNNHSMILNCHSETEILGGGEGYYGGGTNGVSGHFGSGGIAGNNEGIIFFSNNTGKVCNNGGGIVGWNNGTISYCNNIADGNGSGIVNINTGKVVCCTNIGDMSGNAVAGIALICTRKGHIERCINLGIMEGRYIGGLVTFLQDEGNIENSISVATRGMKAIDINTEGKIKAIQTISPKLTEREKNLIDIRTIKGYDVNIREIFISLLKNKKRDLILKSVFLFLLSIILWKLESLKKLYKEVIYQPPKYRRLSNSLRKATKNGDKIELGHITFEEQTFQLYWDVLYQEEDRLLLISSENVCCHVYHERYQSIHWYESSIFHWLNSEFYETCFTEVEREFLDGEITILDRMSVEKFLPLKTMRQSKNSKYAYMQGALSKGGYGCWWLKSYIKTDRPPFVTADGRFSTQGMKNNFVGICVRPVVCIRLRNCS